MTINNVSIVDNSVSHYKNVYSGSKYDTNADEKLIKKEAIEALKKCNSKTPSKEVAECLENLFGLWHIKRDHWLVLARRYTPKAINSVVSEMIKGGQRGDIDLELPGRYFTYLLTSFHKPRRHIKRNVYTNDVERDQYGRYHKTIVIDKDI